MIMLTGGGSFAAAYQNQSEAEIASIRQLSEPEFLKKLSQATTIIHNAATIDGTDLEFLTVRNFDFTRFVVQKTQELNPQAHLILLSSMSVLDPENSEVYGDVLAMTPYAYSKYLAETYCLKSSFKHVSCVRFSTLFFQDPKKDGLSKLIADAVTSGKITVYNGGEARRNFLPLRVAVQYVAKIAGQAAPGKQTYTLAAPASTSFGDVAEILKKLLPSLQVEDRSLPSGGAPVLAEFSTANITTLGQIDFSLEDEIAAYVRELRA